MFIKPIEIAEIVLMVLALGYIFSHFFRRPLTVQQALRKPVWYRFFDLESIKFSMIITAPAVVLHELGHKFVALAMGFPAQLYGMLTGVSIIRYALILGVVLRLVSAPFIFFLPGYVGPPYDGAWASMSAVQMGGMAFAGPAVNLTLFFLFWGLLASNRWPKYNRIFYISRMINIWLFALNMLPIPPLDGYKVYAGLAAALGFI